MARKIPKDRADREIRIHDALLAVANNGCPSLHQAAGLSQVSYATLHVRMSGRISRVAARVKQQTLSNTEETTLVRWITRLTRTGFPALPKLVM